MLSLSAAVEVAPVRRSSSLVEELTRLPCLPATNLPTVLVGELLSTAVVARVSRPNASANQNVAEPHGERFVRSATKQDADESHLLRLLTGSVHPLSLPLLDMFVPSPFSYSTKAFSIPSDRPRSPRLNHRPRSSPGSCLSDDAQRRLPHQVLFHLSLFFIRYTTINDQEYIEFQWKAISKRSCINSH